MIPSIDETSAGSASLTVCAIAVVKAIRPIIIANNVLFICVFLRDDRDFVSARSNLFYNGFEAILFRNGQGRKKIVPGLSLEIAHRGLIFDPTFVCDRSEEHKSELQSLT